MVWSGWSDVWDEIHELCLFAVVSEWLCLDGLYGQSECDLLWVGRQYSVAFPVEPKEICILYTIEM